MFLVFVLYRDLADTASNIIQSMGDYNLIYSNCQIFADKFLWQVTGKGYITYNKKAGLLSFGSPLYLVGGFMAGAAFGPIGALVGAGVYTALFVGVVLTK